MHRHTGADCSHRMASATGEQKKTTYRQKVRKQKNEVMMRGIEPGSPGIDALPATTFPCFLPYKCIK